MLDDICQIIPTKDVPFALIQKLTKTPKQAVIKLLQTQCLVG
jgi:hypothetical protein